MSHVIIHFKTTQPDTLKSALSALTGDHYIDFQPASESYKASLLFINHASPGNWYSWHTFITTPDDYRNIFHSVLGVKDICELIFESTSNSDQVWNFDFKQH